MRALALALLPALAAASCGDDDREVARVEPTDHWAGSLAPAWPGGVVVAEVNGDPIYDVEIARHAAARGLTPRQALDELVDLQLLAQEAYRRGLADDPDVAETRKRERARALMRLDFEPDWTSPERVPQSEVDEAWGRREIYLHYNHARHHEVAFFRVKPPKGTRDDKEWQVARARALELRALVEARAPTTFEELKEIVGRAIAERGWDNVGVDKHTTAADGGGRVDPTFAAIAFTIDEVGELSQPGYTKWGVDVHLLVRVIPEVWMTKEEAAPDIRKNLFESSRRIGWLEWSDAFLRGHDIVKHEERLEMVTVEAPAADL